VSQLNFLAGSDRILLLTFSQTLQDIGKNEIADSFWFITLAMFSRIRQKQVGHIPFNQGWI
jgi:hypothetical protein